VLGGLLALVGAAPLHAQSDVWRGTAQVNGALLYGEQSQRTLGGRATLTRVDTLLEFSGALQGLYGDASSRDGVREVTKRLWLGSLNADWRPHARWSPFLLATLETNLEKRLAARYNVGLGVKYTAWRTTTDEGSLSVALLDERIDPLAATAPTTRLTRWSTRLRVRHAFSERTRLSHITFWRPSVRSVDRFVVQSTTELHLGLTPRTAVTVSVLDLYDSEAVGRGARRYRDGQLLFGAQLDW
jgi:hypothetical protein